VSADGRRVVALVAARDEEATIAMTVKALAGLERINAVVVVANGCSDRTADEASMAGARTFVGAGRGGKGGALEAAIDRVPADAYLLVDGDVGGTAAEADALLEKVLAGELDLAIGVLPPLAGGGFGIVKGFAGWWIKVLAGFEASAPLSGQRAVTRKLLSACRPLADGFGLETAMTIDAVRLGFRVGEVPVEMTHRATGRGPRGFLHRARQGRDIARAVAPRALRLR
jgi:glycosyltransferase involved in cell wall biosynthesis